MAEKIPQEVIREALLLDKELDTEFEESGNSSDA